MWRRMVPLLNFFPLGRKSGPEGQLFPFSNIAPITERPPMPRKDGAIKFVSRNDLQLMCRHCRFEWRHDALSVRCPLDPEHQQRETWLPPDWTWGSTQPLNYNRYYPHPQNHRTGQWWGPENAKSNNNERRAQGITRLWKTQQREQRGMARSVSKIGSFGTQWKTYFPFPT